MYADLTSPVSKIRVDVTGQRLRIGAGDVHVDMVRLAKSVQNVVERDICPFSVFGGDAGEVDAFGENFARHLNLVDKHIVPLAVRDDF